MNLENLMNIAEALAKELSDGHITISRFTTGWQAELGTVEHAREEDLSSHWKDRPLPTLEGALTRLIDHHLRRPCVLDRMGVSW